MNKKELQGWMESTDNTLDDIVKDLNWFGVKFKNLTASVEDLEHRFGAMQNVNAERLHAELGNRIDALKKKDGQRIDTLFAKVNNLTAEIEMMRDETALDMSVHLSEPPLDSIIVDGEGFVWQRHRIGWAMAGSEDALSWSRFLDEVGDDYEVLSTEPRIERVR